MRDYFTPANLARGAVLGSAATVMALPRILQAGDQAPARVAAGLFCMSLVGSAVTAWGRKADMRGPFLSWRETLQGLGIALLVAAFMSPVQILIVHPAAQRAVESAGNTQWAKLQFPASPADWVGLALWAAGFQALFGVMGPTCLAARLTGRQWPAYVLTAGLAAYIAHRQLDAYQVETARAVLIAASAGKGLLASMIYTRSGLIPCCFLSFAYTIPLLWYVL